MNFNVITLFPELFGSWMNQGLIGKAIEKKTFNVSFVNPRDSATDRHKTVDDRPFGGGDGMVMLYEPLAKSIEALRAEGRLGRLVYMSPQGKLLNSDWAKQVADSQQPLTLLSGRYGGVDQRLIEDYVDEEISIGDYILCGGEIPAMCVMEVVARYLPGVLGNELSSQNESFQNGLLEAPQFTRPALLNDRPVPEILMQGNHKKIDELRKDLALVLSELKRPELTLSLKEDVRSGAEALMQLTDAELKSCGLHRKQLKRLAGQELNS